MRKKWIYPGLHILGWALLGASAVWSFMRDYPSNTYEVRLSTSLGWPPVALGVVLALAYQVEFMAAFYTAYGWIAPSLFPRLRYGRAPMSIAGACLLTVAARFVTEYGILKPLIHYDNYLGRVPSPWWYTYNCLGVSFNYFFFGTLLYFLVRSSRANQERITAELSFLKSQVNPHFLFNTINDIYALVYQKSEEAPEALLKLSGILRYTLYEDSRERVSLSTELAYVTDFLELQQIGSKRQLHIDFKVEGDPRPLQIAPFLLIPFAENIVKHGVTDDPEQPARLHVRVEDDRFHLSAVNGIGRRQKDRTGGIGLSNVRRRLELLYPGRYSFRIKEEDHIFACTLNIQLRP
jgi:two-component system, LytTR family, sensor kinase